MAGGTAATAHGARVALLALGMAGALAISGCGGGGDKGAVATTPATGGDQSTYAPGEASLASNSGYLAVAGRAQTYASGALRDYSAGITGIEAAKQAARKRAVEEARRRYEEAKRRAEEAYRRALAKARKQREAQRLAILRRKRAIERARREFERKLRINPGEECGLPEVRDTFKCLPGRLQPGKPKKKK